MSRVLNADKTALFTGPRQPPSTITTDHGVTLRVLSHNVGQEMVELHIKCVRRPGAPNKFWRTGEFPFFSVSAVLIKLFHPLRALQVGTPPFTTDDLHFRKFCRSIVGPPPYIDWTLEWHEMLHAWDEQFVLVRIGNWHHKKTRATSLHFGNGAEQILRPERV